MSTGRLINSATKSVGGSDTGRSRHSPKPSPSSTSGEGARAVNRAERRRLRAMGERVDHKPDADCDFVRRFPHSRYCNRRIYEGERAEFERMGSTSMEPPAGLAVFVAVDQIFPG
jgi:hypothetical protein